MWKFPGAHAERRETWFAPHCTPLRRFWDRQSSVWGLCLSHDRSSRRGCSLSVICSVEASVRALKEYGYAMLVASCMLEEGSMPACLSVSLYVSHRSILPIPGSPRRRERHDIPRCPVACRQCLFFVTQHAAFRFTADSLLGKGSHGINRFHATTPLEIKVSRMQKEKMNTMITARQPSEPTKG